jgi:hypothetical protein
MRVILCSAIDTAGQSADSVLCTPYVAEIQNGWNCTCTSHMPSWPAQEHLYPNFLDVM